VATSNGSARFPTALEIAPDQHAPAL